MQPYHPAIGAALTGRHNENNERHQQRELQFEGDSLAHKVEPPNRGSICSKMAVGSSACCIAARYWNKGSHSLSDPRDAVTFI
jgi:hypothetical protein